MIHLSGDIIFAEKQKLTVGNREINTWVYYDPERDIEIYGRFRSNVL